MSEHPISITSLNDFTFCPVSIYFHSLDYDTEKISYQENFQINGAAAHSAIDNGKYSNKKNILQSIPVYSEKYGVFGKIDLFDIDTGVLTERKKKVKAIFDGNIFQLYAQYFALIEMGYSVKCIRFYSMDDNKVYPISLPNEDGKMFSAFIDVLNQINNFAFDNFRQDNLLKCQSCIYEPLCSYSCKSEGERKS